MPFIKKFFLGIFFSFVLISSAWSYVNFEYSQRHWTLTYSGYTNYSPFGTYKRIKLPYSGYREEYTSTFSAFAQKFFADNNIEAQLRLDTDYLNLIRRVRAGEIDILFGAYYNTKRYDGFDFVMPALIDNHVILIMLPSNVGKVKNLEDLKKLKGAIWADDQYTDYVSNELKKFNLSEEKDNYEIFRKLFTQEIDYIIGTYYFSVAQAAELGLVGRLSFSKQPLWNMPIFIAVSKASANHKAIYQSLLKFVESKENKALFTDAMKKVVHQLEQKSMRTTPPVFTK